MGWLDALRDLGGALSEVTERWVPDAWVICMMLTAVALALTLFGAGAELEETVLAWGAGVWNLLELAMQFTIALVAAHACVASRPVHRTLDLLAGLPDPQKPVQAVALAGSVSLVTGYLNWAFCIVACALFVPFLCKRNPRADVRVLVAASYIGLGTVWHGGFSGSGPLILATPGNPLLEPGSGLAVVDRLYPVTETLFNPFNLVYLPVIGVVGLVASMALHPRRNVRSLTSTEVERILPKPPEAVAPLPTPAGRLDAFRGWVWLAVILLVYPLGHSIATRGFGVSWSINAYNVVFLALALVLHGRPLPFLRACRDGVDAAWGIILQFPFYAGIFGLMQNTALGTWLGTLFAELASQRTYPLLVYVYSGVMNLFVPSAGSKWLIEAPFLLPAGQALDVSTVTVLLAYAYGDSTTNLIQPFLAIPILAVTRMRFGDIVGYTFLIALPCLAVNLVAMFLIPVDL